EVPADRPQLVRELDAEEVVRRADVLPPPVSGVARDDELNLLQQSAVLFDSVTDIGHRHLSNGSAYYRSVYYASVSVFRGMDGNPTVSRIFYHRAKVGRSPSMTVPVWPSIRMKNGFPLCWYSMNHTGAWSSSPSYVVG